jgi:hypothetical protein
MITESLRAAICCEFLPEVFASSGRYDRPLSAANERHRRMTGAQTERKHTLRVGRLIFISGEHVVETFEPSLL